MASIYESARLTIAAAAAGDSNGGCFISKELLTPVQLPNGCTNVNIEKNHPDGSRSSIHLCLINSALSSNPLQTRGWTLQETLLSRRLLIFGAGRLSWRCAEASITHENGIHWMPRGLDTNTFRVGPNFKALLEHPEATELMQHVPASNLWYTMMEEYSKRKLLTFLIKFQHWLV